MREIIFTCLVNILIGVTGNAQSQYEQGMEKAFDFWENQQPEKAANLFERIATAEEDNWLPFYYASQIKIIESFGMDNAVKKEQQLKKAQELLDGAKQTGEEENVEIMILQAMLHTSYITMEPVTYGRKLSPVILEIYERALQKAPKNPRVVLSKVEWDMGAAKFFGQDTKQFCDDLEASLRLFEKSNPEEGFAPSWGEKRAKMLIYSTCGD